MKQQGILIVGAGELGLAVVRGFAERAPARSEAKISVLLRPGGSSAHPRNSALDDLGVKLVEADLAVASVEQLADVFRPFETVINCSGYAAGAGTQTRVTDAILEAGVQRYLPWQFGVDYDAVGLGSGQPVWDEQLRVRNTLRAQNSTHWLIVSTGMFTSFLFEPDFGVVDWKRRRVRALGSWDYRVTLTTPEDIGRLTASIVLTRPELHDQIVYLAGDTLSYRELLQEVEQATGHRFGGELLTLEQLRSFARQHPDDLAGVYRLAFARSTGVAWNREISFNAQRGLPTTTVRQWLAQNRPFEKNGPASP